MLSDLRIDPTDKLNYDVFLFLWYMIGGAANTLSI